MAARTEKSCGHAARARALILSCLDGSAGWR
jgi:hypothetical protein